MSEIVPMIPLAYASSPENFFDGDWVETKDQDPNGGIRLLQLADIGVGSFLDKSDRWINDEAFHRLQCSELVPGDVLIARMPDPIGRACILPKGLDRCITVVDVAVLRPDRAKLIPEFLVYILNEASLTELLEIHQGGSTRQRISRSRLGQMRIPMPSLEIQHCIANYLDRETGEIDAMIDKLGELNETLQARKIEFIRRETQFSYDGTSWDAVPTAHLFETIGSGTTPKGDAYYTESGTGIPWVTTSELRENVVHSTAQDVTTNAVETVSSLTTHPKGSVVIAMYGATIGRLGILGVDATMNQACCAFSSPRNIDLKFFYYTLWGQRDDIVRLAVGGGQPNISQNTLRRWKVPVPPLEEQRRIADHLDDVTSKIDAMLSKVAQLKDLLTERRAALITDVVTGRKDVT